MAANLLSADYVLPLADPRASLDTVGGKGASLARLVAAGLPVPVVPARCRQDRRHAA